MTSNFNLNLPLAHVALDRDYLAREQPDLLDSLWDSQETKVLVMHQQQVLLSESGGLKFLPAQLVPTTSKRTYLGRTLDGQVPIVLATLSEFEAQGIEPTHDNWHGLRRSGLGLSPSDAAIFTQALALANWHNSHEFCPRCGAVTEVAKGGWVRICPTDNQEIYPRTDPAIIVGVIDKEDRILLGSQGVWEENRFSVLAGFVEPGESLEAAVIREMKEEAGIQVANPEYLGSQAWPFPYSLMLGFMARHVGGDLIPDGEEIVRLRWVTRDELKAEAHQMLLPGKLSIARAIIEKWLGEKLESGE